MTNSSQGSPRTISVEDYVLAFQVDNAEHQGWMQKLEGGRYEPATTHFLLHDAHTASVFADVGAYVGYFTLLMAKAMSDGVVESFEMDRRNFETLKKNVAINHLENARIHRMGVSDSDGKGTYVKGPDRYGAAHQLGRSRRRVWNNWINRTRLVTLDSFFLDRRAPDIVKIDVQGAELAVLRGMRRLLSGPSMKVYVEVHPGAMRTGFGAEPGQVVDLLQSNGFDLWIIPDFRGTDPSLEPLKSSTPIVGETMIYARK